MRWSPINIKTRWIVSLSAFSIFIIIKQALLWLKTWVQLAYLAKFWKWTSLCSSTHHYWFRLVMGISLPLQPALSSSQFSRHQDRFSSVSRALSHSRTALTLSTHIPNWKSLKCLLNSIAFLVRSCSVLFWVGPSSESMFWVQAVQTGLTCLQSGRMHG